MGTVSNIKLQPMNVYIGSDQAQVQKITCVADVSSSLNNKYFLIYLPGMTTRYYVWLDTGTGVDPALSGYTGVHVTISANATATAVATAVKTAVDALAGFVATSSGQYVTVTNASNGYAPAAHDSVAAKTEFAFEVITVGDTYVEMGYIDGDIEVSGLSRTPVDITSHQTGSTLIGAIMSGAGNPELSFSLKEVTAANYEKILKYSGGSAYPIAGSSTVGVGGGRFGQFKSLQYAKVVLHPVSKDAADKSEDLCFWRCSIDLDSVAFSSENILTLPIMIKAFEDSSKKEEVSVWMLGDWSQDWSA